jgi:hypothetical protein
MKRLDELLRRFAEAEKKLLQTNFLAPTTGMGKIAVRLPNGAIYFFRPVPNFSGWGIFQPTGIDTLQLVREAHEWERLAYLEALPALRAIAVHPLRGKTWLCVAFNRSDAHQRNFPTEPFLAHLFLPEVAPLDVVIVRTDGSNWWYDGLDTHYDLERSERLRAFVQSQLASCLDAPTPLERLKRLRSYALTSVPNASPEEAFACELLFAEERRKWEEKEWEQLSPEEKKRLLTEQEMRWQLSLLGAQLVSVHQEGDTYLIRWRDGHREHTTVLDASLSVLSAGVCLAGREQEFDLASIVSVMREAERMDWR